MPEVEEAEYEEEIRELQRKLLELEENEAEPSLVEEYAAEVRILSALLAAARRLRSEIEGDRALGQELELRGLKSSQFKDVYSFVYEAALEFEESGAAYARAIDTTDFSQFLRT